MALRSWLIVPADSEKKLGMAMAASADAVVLDLADSVAIEAKEVARERARKWLIAHRQQVATTRKAAHWVRINPLESRQWRDDLVAVMQGNPAGIILPRAADPEAARQLSAELYEIEQRSQIAPNATKLIVMTGATAAATIATPAFAEASLPRLSGLAWDYKTLAESIGATRTRDSNGAWTAAFAQARTQTLLAAHARGIVAIEAPHRDHYDGDLFEAAVMTARADGFTGMFAVHPAQVDAINSVFTPTQAELTEAQTIVAAHAGEPLAPCQTLDRRLIEGPLLNQARRLLGVED